MLKNLVEDIGTKVSGITEDKSRPPKVKINHIVNEDVDIEIFGSKKHVHFSTSFSHLDEFGKMLIQAEGLEGLGFGKKEWGLS